MCDKQARNQVLTFGGQNTFFFLLYA